MSSSSVASDPSGGPGLSLARRSSLRLRTHFLIGTLLVLVPMVVFSGAMMFMRLEQQRSLNNDLLADMSREVAARVDAGLAQTVAALQALGQSDALRKGDLRAFHALGTRLVKARQWENLQLMGPAGEHLVNVRVPFGTALPPLYSAELPIKAGATRTPLLSNLIKGVVSGRVITTLYVPVAGGRASSTYVIAVSMTPDQWRQVIHDDMGGRRGMHTMLLDRRSNLIASTFPDDPSAVGMLLPPFAQVSADAVAGGKPEIAPLFGHSSYVVSRPTAFGWSVASFVPVEAFDGSLRQSALSIGVGLALFLVITVLMAFWLARRTTRSVSELVASVLSVADGGLPRPGKHHILEIEQAGDALSRTAGLLSSRLHNEELAHAKLERTDHAKNEFLAFLGHELRNPLAAIRNGLELLKRAPPGSQGARLATSVIDRQCAHLSRLVGDLLDVTRVEQGKIELRREIVDLREVVEGVAEDHRGRLEQAGLRLDIDVAPEPVLVNCDGIRLAQVVGNLLHNAAKFTEAGGRIAIRVSHRGETAVVEVSDTGSGIEPQNLDLIFNLFAQGRPSGTGINAGLGLGLALARKLVELHGGTIRAHSTGAGQGSTFRIELPEVVHALQEG